MGLGFVFLFAALMTILYLLRVFTIVFFGETKIAAREGTPVMVACVLILAFLSLAAGIGVRYPLDMVQRTTAQMIRVIP
jgi:NADH:ubiquinone oxidoreductase subunit 5 (subunit L)/multisubunit Na+/H+ antiporter MnhA subunit